MKEIIVEVTETGEITLETRGFKGASCLEEAKFLKEVLGEETKRSLTPAYFQKQGEIVKSYLPLCG